MKIKNKNEDLEKIKWLLLNIDMIKGFVEEGALADPSIKRIIPENIRLIEMFLDNKEAAVAFIEDEHTQNSVEFNTFGTHALKGTKEAELTDELKPYEQDALVYKKNSTNLVFAPHFIEDIEKMTNLKVVVLNGCLTEVCVKNGGITLKNLFDQNNRDIVIMLDEAGVDTFNAPGHKREEVNESAIEDMRSNGIQIVKRISRI